MEALLAQLIDWFALPKNGLSSVFIVALVSATLLPLASEPAVFGFVKLNPDQFWMAITVAMAGNTLGGVINYWMGRGAKQAVAKDKQTRYLAWFEKLGPKALFFSFLPAVGDPMCAVAGWLKLNFWSCVGWIAIGRLVRYGVMTSILLWVPNDWWRALFSPIANILGV
jgi:membrane protein YqaA with SNARE-associated domain